MLSRRASYRLWAALAWSGACAAPPPNYAPPRTSTSPPVSVLPVLEAASAPTEPAVHPDLCRENTSLYVLSTKGDLYALKDMVGTFRLVGTLACPQLRIDAMGFDREGELWLTSHDGGLYRVLRDDLTCSPDADRSGALAKRGFGIAWTTDALYASDNPTVGGASSGLYRIDRARVLEGKGRPPTFLGRFSDGLQGKSADLAFDDEGHLHGLFNTEPLTFAPVDDARALTPRASQRVLPGTSPGAWAISYWNKEFWLFTASKNDKTDENSEIWKVDRESGTPQRLKKRTSFYVVGAGRGPCSHFGKP